MATVPVGLMSGQDDYNLSLLGRHAEALRPGKCLPPGGKRSRGQLQVQSHQSGIASSAARACIHQLESKPVSEIKMNWPLDLDQGYDSMLALVMGAFREAGIGEREISLSLPDAEGHHSCWRLAFGTQAMFFTLFRPLLCTL